MGHPEFYFPPIAMRLRWMGHPLVAAQQSDGDEGGGEGPEERGLAVDGEDEAEAGKTALGGEGNGPGEVVVQADGDVDEERGCGECGECAGEEPELRGEAGALQSAGEGERCDGGERDEEEGKADVLLEEEREDAGCSGEEVARRGFAGALEESRGRGGRRGCNRCRRWGGGRFRRCRGR